MHTLVNYLELINIKSCWKMALLDGLRTAELPIYRKIESWIRNQKSKVDFLRLYRR